jgi:hypothetical protein
MLLKKSAFVMEADAPAEYINQCVNNPTSGGVLKGGFLEECGDLF